MAQDNLILTVSPAILEALGLPPAATKLDYFAFFGLDPAAGFTVADVDRAVIERSKILRPWQNSPTHGPDVVKLLPMLHRIAAILKDPVRREAYRKQIEKLLSGRKIDPLAEFRGVVLAALADGRLDPATKAELLRYARQNRISIDDAGRIINDVMAEKGGSDETSAMTESKWEFALASAENKGPEAFRGALEMAFQSASMNPNMPGRIAADPERFGISKETGQQIFTIVAGEWFRNLVGRVATDGVINENQARILLPKAGAVGIGPQQAYDILSEYMFSSASREEIETFQLETEAFSDEEIGQLLQSQKVVLYRSTKDVILRLLLSGPGLSVMTLLVIGVIGVALFQGAQESARRKDYEIQARSVAAQYTITPSPTPSYDPAKPWILPKPDPADGFLRIDPVEPGDPPSFRIKITEVTCAEYQKFLVDTFHPRRPEGWGLDYSLPAGTDPGMPVIGMKWADAVEFCAWTAKTMKLPEGSVRLPGKAEFDRVMRGGFMPEGHRTSEPNFWKILRFTQYARIAPPRQNKALDVLYFSGGQVYDLIANVAEWGMDEAGGSRIVLGGDYAFGNSPGADPLAPRYQDPEKPSNLIGFRYIITAP